MRNENNPVHILLDAGARVILLQSYPLFSTLGVYRTVMDIRFLSMSQRRYKETVVAHIGGSKYNVLRTGKPAQQIVEDDVPEQLRVKKARCARLAIAFEHLGYYINNSTEQYWTTKSISYEDLPIYYANKAEFAKTFADSQGIELSLAEKQLDFDVQHLVAMALRRKQLQWTQEKLLMDLHTQADLDNWIDQLNNSLNMSTV